MTVDSGPGAPNPSADKGVQRRSYRIAAIPIPPDLHNNAFELPCIQAERGPRFSAEPNGFADPHPGPPTVTVGGSAADQPEVRRLPQVAVNSRVRTEQWT